MAMKRKAPSGRYRRRVKRKYMRKSRVPRAPRRVGSIMVKRSNYVGNWTFGTATTNDFWRYFAYDMTAFNQFSEFAAVFDEYKLNSMKVTFRPAYDSVLNDLAVAQAYAHYFVDPASTVIPTGTYTSTALNTFLQNDKVRTRTLNRPFSIYWRPKLLDQVLNTGTGAAMRSSPWIRTTETGASYRGFHMFLQQNNFVTTNTAIKLDVFVTMYVSFRNLK